MSTHTKAWIAFIFVCIVWGTTYLGIKVGVEAWPAFLFAAVRQVISAAILIGIAFMVARKDIVNTRMSMLHNAIVGCLMITIGNGLVSWAEKFVPSGVAALICSLMPIAGVLINLASKKRESVNWIIICGMLLGVGGVVLIFLQGKGEEARSDNYMFGILGLVCATTAWAWGTIINKKNPPPGNAIFNSGMQLLFGGLLLGIVSPLADDYGKADFMNANALWALLYLIIFGSVLAYTAYMYALQNLPSGLVMSYAYINPLVAVVLGTFFGEPGGVWIIASFAAILLGVYIVKRGYRIAQQADAAR